MNRTEAAYDAKPEDEWQRRRDHRSARPGRRPGGVQVGVIRTDRCELTALRPEDLDAVVRLNNDAEVRRYLGGPRDADAARADFPALLDPDGTDRTWAIRLQSAGEFLGLVFLGSHHNGSDTEVSYMLLPEFWGRGYDTEAVGVVIGYALTQLGVPRMVAETQTANLASRRLLERLGLTVAQTLVRFDAEQVVYTTALPT